MKLKVKGFLKTANSCLLVLIGRTIPIIPIGLMISLEIRVSPASLVQLFLTYWEGNSGDKLLECKTRETE